MFLFHMSLEHNHILVYLEAISIVCNGTYFQGSLIWVSGKTVYSFSFQSTGLMQYLIVYICFLIEVNIWVFLHTVLHF